MWSVAQMNYAPASKRGLRPRFVMVTPYDVAAAV
jgi:hypothetical protein